MLNRGDHDRMGKFDFSNRSINVLCRNMDVFIMTDFAVLEVLPLKKLLTRLAFTKLTGFFNCTGGCRGHDRMVVGFTTTYVISANHH